MKMRKLLKRISAALLSGLLVAGMYAVPVRAVPVTGSITVHKFAVMGDSSIPHDGTLIQDDSILGTKLKGAGFTLYKVKPQVIVTSASTPDGFTASELEMVGTEQITQADGVTTWNGLEKGYYVLKETTTPNGYNISAASLIKFPFAYSPDPTAQNSTVEPNWDVHVYPKNVDNEFFRKVNSNASEGPFFVGDNVKWALQGSIDSTRTLTAGSVKDIISPMLSYQTSGVKLTGGTGAINLVAETDYKTTPAIVPAGHNGEVVWSLTPEGIQKAINNQSTGIVVDLETVVNETAQNGSGVSGIDNEASYEMQYATGAPVTGGDSERAVTGGVAVDKYVNNPADITDKMTKLAGAKFKLQYQDAVGNWLYLKDQNNLDIVVTTNGDGFAQFLDFRTAQLAADKMSNGKVDWTKEQIFKLQEVSAPQGYVLREAILEVMVPAGARQVSYSFANQKVTDPAIPGDPTPSFQLPLTGGAGTVLFTAIGLVLMGGAAIVLIRNRKRSA